MNFSVDFKNIQRQLKTGVQSFNNRKSNPTFCGLDKDVFEPSSKTSEAALSQGVQGDVSNFDIGLNFGKDLMELVKSGNADFNKVQDLIKKHVNSDCIIVHPMSDYRTPDGQPLPKNSARAAITRPTFDEDGNISKVELFIPEINYSDKNSVLEFIDKASHEVTHVAQFVNKTGEYKQHYSPSNEGRFLNYVQKKITDVLTDKGVKDTTLTLLKSLNVGIKNVDDYYKFMDSEGNITEEQIGEFLNFGNNPAKHKEIINEIFDSLYESILNGLDYRNDPTIIGLMKKCGGYDELKTLVRKICSESFKNEQEAYKVGNMIRKEYNEIEAEQTNNDLINVLMGVYSKALA